MFEYVFRLYIFKIYECYIIIYCTYLYFYVTHSGDWVMVCLPQAKRCDNDSCDEYSSLDKKKKIKTKNKRLGIVSSTEKYSYNKK